MRKRNQICRNMCDDGVCGDFTLDDSEFNKELSETKSLIGAINPVFLDEIGKVLAHGAKKYGRDNWKLAKGKKEQLYIDALYRHINSFHKGELIDEETGLHHLAHATCNLMFLYCFGFENDTRC